MRSAYLIAMMRMMKKTIKTTKTVRKICKLVFCNIQNCFFFSLFFDLCFLIVLFRNVRLENLCASCKSGGKLISCDTCSNHYHLECVEPPLSRAPRGRWSCSKCKAKRRNATKGNERMLSILKILFSFYYNLKFFTYCLLKL